MIQEIIYTIEEIAHKIEWSLSAVWTAIANPNYSIGEWLRDLRSMWTI